jgi:hypothetical protein
MKSKWSFVLRIAACGVGVAALAYDAKFAGIPFQDASAGQRAAYARHARVVSVLVGAAAGLGVASLLAAAVARRRG